MAQKTFTEIMNIWQSTAIANWKVREGYDSNQTYSRAVDEENMTWQSMGVSIVEGPNISSHRVSFRVTPLEGTQYTVESDDPQVISLIKPRPPRPSSAEAQQRLAQQQAEWDEQNAAEEAKYQEEARRVLDMTPEERRAEREAEEDNRPRHLKNPRVYKSTQKDFLYFEVQVVPPEPPPYGYDPDRDGPWFGGELTVHQHYVSRGKPFKDAAGNRTFNTMEEALDLDRGNIKRKVWERLAQLRENGYLVEDEIFDGFGIENGLFTLQYPQIPNYNTRPDSIAHGAAEGASDVSSESEWAATGLSAASGDPGTSDMPMRPTNDQDVERFKQEMVESNLLFGEGDVSGIPEAPLDPPEPDLTYEHFESDTPRARLGANQPLDPLGDPVGQTKAQAAKDKRPEAPTKVKPGSQPAIMVEGIARDVAPHVGKGQNTGLLNRPLPEPVPFFQKCASDKVVSGKNNTWIVFGRDRPGGLSSGYGPGMGQTQAGAIDIVVGRMSPKPISFDSKGNKQFVGPLFKPEKYTYESGETLSVMDAARIYISQKTDLDANFGLNTPPKTKSSQAVSGIAMKADGIRIMSRKAGIRLVTEDANSVSSKGGSGASEPMGICLIAANKASELQPLIKGDNLTLLLKEMLNNQASIAGAVASLKQDMIEMYGAILTHEHVTPTAGVSVKLPQLTAKALEKIVKLVSVDTFSAFSLQQEPEVIEKTYLEDGSKASIKSKYNKVN